jgi:uncharacterized protein DUF397
MNTHENDHSDPTGAVWRKASYSNGNGGDCVEVADLHCGHHAVRDSKDPAGLALTCTAAHWGAFIAGIRTGEFG